MTKKLLTSWMALVIVLLVVTGTVLSGCTRGSGAKADQVTMSGSTALLPLAQLAKEQFEQKHQNITVNVGGGGSFTGLNQVLAGGVDIGNSDVDVNDYPDFNGEGLVDHVVAVAPFVIIVNPQVRIEDLTSFDARRIFSGQVTDWAEVGGAKQEINIIHRAPSSGSRAVVKNIVLGGEEFSDRAVALDSNGAVRQAVSNTPGAIGYVDAAYLDSSVRALRYEGISYSKENVAAGQYPIYAFEHMYTRGEPQGPVRQFIDFVLSEEFQSDFVEKAGFLPAGQLNGG